MAGGGGDGGGNARHGYYAYRYTEDPIYLQIVAAELDSLRFGSWEGDIDYYLGVFPGKHATNTPNVARYVPRAMALLAEFDEEPEPLHKSTALPTKFPTDNFPTSHVFHDGNGPLRFLLNERSGQTVTCSVRIEGPQGVVVDEEMMTSDQPVELDLPAGVYSFSISGYLRGLYFPLTWPDIPEVLQFDTDEEDTATYGGRLGYWFQVPEGVRQFRVRFVDAPMGRWPVQRATVWNPDGERAWDRSHMRADLPVEAVIDVPAGQDGKVWRVTGGPVIMDPQIPPYFSFSRSKWFNPESESSNTKN